MERGPNARSPTWLRSLCAAGRPTEAAPSGTPCAVATWTDQRGASNELQDDGQNLPKRGYLRTSALPVCRWGGRLAGMRVWSCQACRTLLLPPQRLLRMNVGQVERALAYDAQRWPLEWAALEELLTLCQFEEGALGERLHLLPQRAFTRAAFLCYVLGWINPMEED